MNTFHIDERGVRVTRHFNLYKPSLFYGSKANSADPGLTPHNVASDQGLYYLLTEHSIKVFTKMKNTT